MYFVSGLQGLDHLMETFMNLLETLMSAVKFQDASKAAEASVAMLDICKKAKNTNKKLL